MCYLKRGFARDKELLHREVLGITNGFPYPSDSKRYEKEPRYNETLDCGEHILSVSWPFVISTGSTSCLEVLFHIFYYYWGEENRSLYRGLRYVEVRFIEVPLQLKH